MTHVHKLASITSSITIAGLAATAAAVDVTVPGNADPWLAGMPNGATASGGDVAPDESPVEAAGLALAGGAILTFSVTGSVLNSAGLPSDPPDGNTFFFTPHSAGPQNGISSVNAPLNALVAVFLDDEQPDAFTAPATLDFRSIGNVPGGIDYVSLAPELRQVFFIGDGSTSGGMRQEIIVPEGATRLFLGTMDGFGWFNNTGAFAVVINGEDCPADLDANGGVGFADLTQMLNAWGVCAVTCPEDLDGSDSVGFADLTTLLNDWGPCGA